MRVTFIAPAPWETVTGASVYDRAMVAALRAIGHPVDVVALPGTHPLPDDVARAAAAAVVATTAIDSVLVIDGLCLPAFVPCAEEFALRPVVGLIHHPTALETGRTDAARAELLTIERDMFARLRHIVVTSADTQRRLVAEFAVPEPRISVVTPATPPAPRSAGPTQDGCLILAVATLLPRKGYDVLFRALSRLMDLDWRLVIAGGEPDRDYAEHIRAIAQDLGVGARVRFLGPVAPIDLAPFWESAGFFASATWYEGYGMAIAEALRRGLPVAVTAGGAAADLVTPDCAVVCPPGDHAGLSRAMRRLIFDRNLRCQMADAAWALGASLPDWPEQAERFASVLSAV